MGNSKQGFTLVELSIVLVIIGLIVSGVVGGQSLIRNAKINKVLSDVESYKTAIRIFGDQYNALPGDITDAYDYWGAAAGCIDAEVDDDANGCNGDGDGWIGKTGGTGLETFRVWQHLNLSEILSGGYSGEGPAPIPGVNVPADPMGGVAGFDIKHWGPINVTNRVYDNNTIDIGKLFTPAESYQMDKKADDGSPREGHIWNNFKPGTDPDHCFNDDADGIFRYRLDHPDKVCGVNFRFGGYGYERKWY